MGRSAMTTKLARDYIKHIRTRLFTLPPWMARKQHKQPSTFFYHLSLVLFACCSRVLFLSVSVIHTSSLPAMYTGISSLNFTLLITYFYSSFAGGGGLYLQSK